MIRSMSAIEVAYMTSRLSPLNITLVMIGTGTSTVRGHCIQVPSTVPIVDSGLVQASSFSTLRALSRRNFGQTFSLKGKDFMSVMIRSSERPIGK